MKKPLKKEYESLNSYKETVDYTCGSALFCHKDELCDEVKPLAEIFHVKQARSCKDDVETEYFNYSNVRGCADLEWLCARCGAGSEESPLDPTTCGKGDVTGYSGFEISRGRLMLPLCMGCRSRKVAPVFVGTTNQVGKERELREAQAKAKAANMSKAARAASAKAVKAAKAAAAKAAAAEAMEEDSNDAEPMEEEATSGGKGAQKRPAPPPANLSSTSGAAKRRARKAEAINAVKPPSLRERARSNQHPGYLATSLFYSPLPLLPPCAHMRGSSFERTWAGPLVGDLGGGDHVCSPPSPTRTTHTHRPPRHARHTHRPHLPHLPLPRALAPLTGLPL